MMLQQYISQELNSDKVCKEFKVLIEDQIDDTLYIGRTEFDAEEIDSVVYIETKEQLNAGDFVDVVVKDSYEYDLRAVLK